MNYEQKSLINWITIVAVRLSRIYSRALTYKVKVDDRRKSFAAPSLDRRIFCTSNAAEVEFVRFNFELIQDFEKIFLVEIKFNWKGKVEVACYDER